jgi:hypothetical protein
MPDRNRHLSTRRYANPWIICAVTAVTALVVIGSLTMLIISAASAIARSKADRGLPRGYRLKTMNGNWTSIITPQGTAVDLSAAIPGCFADSATRLRIHDTWIFGEVFDASPNAAGTRGYFLLDTISGNVWTFATYLDWASALSAVGLSPDERSVDRMELPELP